MRKIILEQDYSREKSLLYMMMWDVSERQGYKEFLGHRFNGSLFIYRPDNYKTTVWSDHAEMEIVSGLLSVKIRTDGDFVGRVIKALDENWEKIFPFLSRKRSIDTIAGFKEYYRALTDWWAAMNTAYGIINDPKISTRASKTFLQYRERTEAYTGSMDEIMIDFWRKKLKKQYRSWIGFMLISEAVRAAKGSITAVEWENIKKRKSGCIIFNRKAYLKTELNEILRKNNFSLTEISSEEVKQFSGQPAFPGKAAGRVQKVMVRADIVNFKPGSILVAETTFPEHVPAMKSAIAFITDEGGITCHAAIVARELKKPCIVGTKIATKVLHDGDLVEVNAKSGIIKIIK